MSAVELIGFCDFFRFIVWCSKVRTGLKFQKLGVFIIDERYEFMKLDGVESANRYLRCDDKRFLIFVCFFLPGMESV